MAKKVRAQTVEVPQEVLDELIAALIDGAQEAEIKARPRAAMTAARVWEVIAVLPIEPRAATLRVLDADERAFEAVAKLDADVRLAESELAAIDRVVGRIEAHLAELEDEDLAFEGQAWELAALLQWRFAGFEEAK